MNRIYDSKEEEYFHHYLLELKDAGYVDWICDYKKTYLLCHAIKSDYNKIKVKGKKINHEPCVFTLIKDKEYTPDFIFKFNDKASKIFVFKSGDVVKHTPLFFCNNQRNICYVDVKGEFGRNLTSSVTFPDRQAMMLNKHNIYVQKVIPISKDKSNLFAKSFTPTCVKLNEVYRVRSKHGKVGDSKLRFTVKSLEEYVDSITT